MGKPILQIIGDMTSDDILIFLMVARRGSLTAAARHLGKDTATVGRRIQRLERALGQTLFAKSPKGYRLTGAGETLLPRAEAMEELTRDITAGFARGDQGIDGKIRIGAPDGCATFLLPQVCAALTRDYPDLIVEIVATAREVDLLGREVDLAITLGPSRAKGIDASHLAGYELHFAAARRLVSGLNGASPLSSLPVIGYIPELLIDPALDVPPDLSAPPAVLRSNSVLVQWQWLRQGAGVGLVHDFTLARDPDLVRVLHDVAIRRSYFLSMRRADKQVPRMQRLRDLLQAAVVREVSAGTSSRRLDGPS